MYINNKQNTLIFNILFFIFLLSIMFLIYGFLTFTYNKISAVGIDENIQEALERKKELGKSVAEVESWGKAAEQIQKFRETYLEKQSKFRDFQLYLDGLIGSTSFLVKSIKYNFTPTKFKGVILCQVVINGNGDYKSLKDILVRIKAKKKLVFCRKMSVKKEKNVTVPKAEFRLEAYFER